MGSIAEPQFHLVGHDYFDEMHIFPPSPPHPKLFHSLYHQAEVTTGHETEYGCGPANPAMFHQLNNMLLLACVFYWSLGTRQHGSASSSPAGKTLVK